MGIDADIRFMDEALALAARGLETTSPNPRVGCVLVRDGIVIGRGFHRRAGEAHAEAAALADARIDPAGATAYVTLEPHSHHGRTPPCTDALIRAGIGRVVIAMRDPNPLVAGRGIEQLRAAGVAVECGLREPLAVELNAGYVLRHQHGRPLVRLKIAASLDGRTALASGESQWITSAAARADVQRWRARSCAVVTGIGTVLADDPALNVRAADGGAPPLRQPLRVICDSRGRIAASARVFANDGPVLVVTAGARPALPSHIECITLPGDGRVDLVALIAELARRGANEVLIEAGATLAGAVIRDGLWDEAVVYLAPVLLGARGRAMFDFEVVTLAEAVRGRITGVEPIGDDLRIVVRR